jgi:hypothetical protein
MSASLPSPALKRSIGVYVLTASFVLGAIVHIAAAISIARVVGMDTLAPGGNLMHIVTLFAPMYGVALLKLAAGACVFLGRREALVLMGILLALLFERLFGLEFTSYLAFDAFVLALQIYFSLRLAGAGKLA